MYTSHGVTWIQSHISLVSKIPIKMHSYGTVCTSLYCYDKEILKAWSIVNVRWQIWENKNMTWISSYIESQCLNDKNNGAEHDQVPIKTSWIDFWRRTSLLISLGMAIPWTGKIYSPSSKEPGDGCASSIHGTAALVCQSLHSSPALSLHTSYFRGAETPAHFIDRWHLPIEFSHHYRWKMVENWISLGWEPLRLDRELCNIRTKTTFT